MKPTTLLMLLALALLSQGCGQKGQLYLPPPEPAPAQGAAAHE